ncbi:Protein SYS1 [Nakaseomyces bracarensis]|uniref:Protein SYS1 n=1 Tax=Nakaseomyces bracarensis TaxID=273131 RepID=A0ABR4NQF7_9SACH
MPSFRRYMRLPQELRPSEIFKQDSMSPGKIALQIVLLQLFYYATACVLFYGWATVAGHKPEVLRWLLSWEYIEFTNALGLSLSLLWLTDSLICVIFLTVIVERSKLAWDFAITIHAINFVVVFIHTGSFPNLPWLVLQVLSSLILVFLGTWTTRWRELRDTFFEGLVDTELASGSSPPAIEMRDLESQK